MEEETAFLKAFPRAVEDGTGQEAAMEAPGHGGRGQGRWVGGAQCTEPLGGTRAVAL